MSCIKCLILKAKKLIKAYMKSTECLKNRIMKKQSHLKIQFHKTGYNKTHLESLQERLPYEEMQHVNITLPCVAISSGNRRRQMRVWIIAYCPSWIKNLLYFVTFKIWDSNSWFWNIVSYSFSAFYQYIIFNMPMLFRILL